MQFFYGIVILILACSAVLTAGCTMVTGPAVPATTLIPVTTPHLPDLALDPAGLPACFSLAEQHVKSSGDVGTLAKDLGWQAGYVVMYTCPSDGSDPTVIVHSLAVYPSQNMPGIASLVDEQDRSAGLVYENLSFAGQYPALRGFYGTAGGANATGTFPGAYPVNGGHGVPGKNAESGTGRAEIIIYRGTVFEVMTMTGPGTNVTLLRALSEKAYGKIP